MVGGVGVLVCWCVTGVWVCWAAADDDPRSIAHFTPLHAPDGLSVLPRAPAPQHEAPVPPVPVPAVGGRQLRGYSGIV